MQSLPESPPAERPHRYRCPNCGAEQVYEPRGGMLTCMYCGRTEPIPESADEVAERSYEEYLRPRAEQLAPIAAGALEVQCQSCGATVQFTPPQVAGRCDFCGTPLVAQPKAADPLVAPEGVLPFRIDQQQAVGALRQWIATRWFAPNALKKFASQESLDGVYLPFWTYDANTLSYYTGARGEYYYVTEQYEVTDAQGNRRLETRQVRHTRWYPASGQVSRWFDDVLVAATLSVPRNRLEALAPWDLNDVRAYDPAFLSGYKAQRYQVELAAGFEIAKQYMAAVIEGDVRNDIGGDEQRIDRIQTSYSGVTFKHLLLPVYAGAYRFNQKVYQFVINGRTGEVQGDRPYSFWKIFFFVLFLLIVAGLLYYVFGGRQ